MGADAAAGGALPVLVVLVAVVVLGAEGGRTVARRVALARGGRSRQGREMRTASRKLAFGLLLVVIQVGLVHSSHLCEAGTYGASKSAGCSYCPSGKHSSYGNNKRIHT